MAGVSRRAFLQHAGGASAVLAFMAANGLKLHASPLGLPIGAQAWPHQAIIGTNSYAGLASLLKQLRRKKTDEETPDWTATESE